MRLDSDGNTYLDDPAEQVEDDQCGHPCNPEFPCSECAVYWDRMRKEGLWIDGSGWTDKARKEWVK